MAVDLMATEKIGDTDNLTSYATDAVQHHCVSCNDPQPDLKPHEGTASVRRKKSTHHREQTICSCIT